MIDVDNLLIGENFTVYNGDRYEVLPMEYIPEFDAHEFDLNDSDQIDKYISAVEKCVRKSIEYQRYISYIRRYMNMNKCSYFENISNVDTSKIKIHIHHSPITLYEIAATILAKRQFYYECTEVEATAKEVMYVHYCLLVGLIPLCETVHELTHNGFIFIPNDKVMGRYDTFIKMYDQWIPPQVKEKIEKANEYTRVYNNAIDNKILEPHYIYLDFQGTYNLPKMQDVITAMENRTQELRENCFSMQNVKPRSIIEYIKQ